MTYRNHNGNYENNEYAQSEETSRTLRSHGSQSAKFENHWSSS